MTKQLCLRTSCSARFRVRCGILPRRPQDVRCERFRQIFALWLCILRIHLSGNFGLHRWVFRGNYIQITPVVSNTGRLMNKIYSAANISTRLRPIGPKDDIDIGNGSGCRRCGYFGL